MDKKSKDLKIVSGEGNELELSPVYEHLNAVKPKAKENKKDKIIIPEVKKIKK